MNEDLATISKWSRQHSLHLNPRKTQTIIYNNTKLSHIDTPKLKLEGEFLTVSEEVKNLGITMDETLSWHSYIKEVCKKVYFTLHTLKRIQIYTPEKIRKLLVQTLIMPIIDYGGHSLQ